jgi:putative ABC transport system permease protein
MFKFLKQTPIAWKQLIKEKPRLLVAISGISFANVLIFFQLGLMDGLYDGATQAHHLIDADLVVTSSKYKSLASLRAFNRERLYQAAANPQVASVSSIYIGTGTWKNPDDRSTKTIQVWGVDPHAPSFRIPELRQEQSQLQLLNRVFFDRGSSPLYGQIAPQVSSRTHRPVEVELNQRVVQVAGLFQLGVSFTADGNVITSDSTFLNLFPQRQAHEIDLGLVHLQPQANLLLVQRQLKNILGEQFNVLTVAELRNAEKHYWESQGFIGFIFGLGALVGFVVGIVIVYQILYTDVANHLPEYATLKAMGYTDRFLLILLLQESLILAVCGFIPGFLVSVGLYQLTFAATLFPVFMKTERAITVLLLTIVMCITSGAIALQKLRSADPADVF